MSSGTDPVNNQTLGGVTYNANQFTGRDLGNGKFELKAKHGGETLIFGQQNQKTRQAAKGERADFYQYPDGTTGDNRYKGIGEHYDDNGNYVGYRSLEGIPMKNMNPRIEMKTDKGWFVDDNNFTIADMMGATFTSSIETVANVKVENSNNVKVDLASNDSGYYGDHADIKGGENNVVIMDSKDRAKINGKSVEGEGTAAQKDY